MSDASAASPPDELFDVLRPDGTPTGVVKRRADVHRDGDWHRAFHLWIVVSSAAGTTDVLFQRRSMGKDTWPGRLDVAVGGHYGAGETLEDVLREIDEELGISPAFSALIHAGERRSISLKAEWRDREIQDVYILAIRGDLPSFRPNAAEIESLLRIDARDLVRLFGGSAEQVAVRVAPVIADRRWARGVRLPSASTISCRIEINTSCGPRWPGNRFSPASRTCR